MKYFLMPYYTILTMYISRIASNTFSFANFVVFFLGNKFNKKGNASFHWNSLQDLLQDLLQNCIFWLHLFCKLHTNIPQISAFPQISASFHSKYSSSSHQGLARFFWQKGQRRKKAPKTLTKATHSWKIMSSKPLLETNVWYI